MGFAVYLRKAVENGHVIFPGDPKVYGFCRTCEEHTFGQKLKCLQCLRSSKSAHSFSAQYFNDPVDSEAVEIKTAWIRKFQWSDELTRTLHNAKGILSIDPAFTLKETNDYVGLAVTKVAPDKHVYVLEAEQRRLSPNDLIKEVFRMIPIYNIGKVLLETNAAQIIFMDLFKQEMIKRNQYFSIEEVHSSTKETKAMRIRGLIPYYANGMILHKPGLLDLEDQLLQFPRNTHDDIIDALSHQIPYWKAMPEGKTYVNPAPYGSLNWWKKQTSSDPQDRVKQLFKDLM